MNVFSEVGQVAVLQQSGSMNDLDNMHHQKDDTLESNLSSECFYFMAVVY